MDLFSDYLEASLFQGLFQRLGAIRNLVGNLKTIVAIQVWNFKEQPATWFEPVLA